LRPALEEDLNIMGDPLQLLTQSLRTTSIYSKTSPATNLTTSTICLLFVATKDYRKKLLDALSQIKSRDPIIQLGKVNVLWEVERLDILVPQPDDSERMFRLSKEL
jgi:hypothetical protein